MAVMRPDVGPYYNSLDEKPVHVFIGLVAPSYDDKLYLKVMSSIAKAMHRRAC